MAVTGDGLAMDEERPLLEHLLTGLFLIVCLVAIAAITYTALSMLNRAVEGASEAVANGPVPFPRLPAAAPQRTPVLGGTAVATPPRATTAVATPPRATTPAPAATPFPTAPPGPTLEVRVSNPRPKSYDTVSITGRLLSDARPIAGAMCTLSAAFRSGTQRWQRTTGPDGTVEFILELVGAAVDYPVQLEMECPAEGKPVRGTSQFVPGG